MNKIYSVTEEKKPTVSELANQKGIMQQADGWKVYHLTAQMDEVVSKFCELEYGVIIKILLLLSQMLCVIEY